MDPIASADEVTPERLEAIRAASAELVRATPVLTTRSLSERCGGTIALKAENLQRTGSFKLRGALSKVRSLRPGRRRGGGQRGNHAQALAYAARSTGCAARSSCPTTRRWARWPRSGRSAPRSSGRPGGGRLPGQRPRRRRRPGPDVRQPLRRLGRDRRPGGRGPGAGHRRARPGAGGGAGGRRRAGLRRGPRATRAWR